MNIGMSLERREAHRDTERSMGEGRLSCSVLVQFNETRRCYDKFGHSKR
jgi:hypothetical protein